MPMEPIINVESLRKIYTIHQCERCGSLVEKPSAQPIDECPFCENLDFKSKYFSALISLVYNIVKDETRKPGSYMASVTNQESKLPDHVVEVSMAHPQTEWAVRMRYGSMYVLHTLNCETGTAQLRVENRDVFGNTQEDFGSRWHMTELIHIWQNILSNRMELTA